MAEQVRTKDYSEKKARRNSKGRGLKRVGMSTEKFSIWLKREETEAKQKASDELYERLDNKD